MQFNLKRILKALLLSTGDPLSIKDIQQVITRYHEQKDRLDEIDEDEELPPEVVVASDPQQQLTGILQEVPTLLTASQIRAAMEEIAAELAEQKSVIRLLDGPNGYRITTAPEMAEWVRLLRNEPRPLRLRQAALETVTIIAYRQPVTRSEMETIRGVSVDSAISKLLELDLIKVVGRADQPGRPIQYGTTDAFLEFLGIRSLEELPASDVLSPNEITEWIRKANEQKDHPAGDADLGLPSEEPQQELDFSEESEEVLASVDGSDEDWDVSEEERGDV